VYIRKLCKKAPTHIERVKTQHSQTSAGCFWHHLYAKPDFPIACNKKYNRFDFYPNFI
jgi:hypothetical protein